jgi:hypothetical protein
MMFFRILLNRVILAKGFGEVNAAADAGIHHSHMYRAFGKEPATGRPRECRLLGCHA